MEIIRYVSKIKLNDYWNREISFMDLVMSSEKGEDKSIIPSIVWKNIPIKIIIPDKNES